MVDNILILIGVFTVSAGIFTYFEMKGKPKNHHSEDGTNIGGRSFGADKPFSKFLDDNFNKFNF